MATDSDDLLRTGANALLRTATDDFVADDSPVVGTDDVFDIHLLSDCWMPFWSPGCTKSSVQHAKCMLDEQRRVAPAISDAVIHLFYGSKLKVDDLASDGKWIGARQPSPA